MTVKVTLRRRKDRTAHFDGSPVVPDLQLLRKLISSDLGDIEDLFSEIETKVASKGFEMVDVDISVVFRQT